MAGTGQPGGCPDRLGQVGDDPGDRGLRSLVDYDCSECVCLDYHQSESARVWEPQPAVFWAGGSQTPGGPSAAGSWWVSKRACLKTSSVRSHLAPTVTKRRLPRPGRLRESSAGGTQVTGELVLFQGARSRRRPCDLALGSIATDPRTHPCQQSCARGRACIAVLLAAASDSVSQGIKLTRTTREQTKVTGLAASSSRLWERHGNWI